jgi:hypothetical protein
MPQESGMIHLGVDIQESQYIPPRASGVSVGRPPEEVSALAG